MASSSKQVYKGIRIKTGEPCAVKMMNLDKMNDKFKQRFLPRELASLMEIKHPNIIRVWDIFKSNHRIWVVIRYIYTWCQNLSNLNSQVFMEFAPNGDVAGYLKKYAALSEDRGEFD